jgi:hypothetical protein
MPKSKNNFSSPVFEPFANKATVIGDGKYQHPYDGDYDYGSWTNKQSLGGGEQGEDGWKAENVGKSSNLLLGNYLNSLV